MFRALWFLIQTGLVVAAAVWISQRPGFVVVEWMDYKLSAQIGVFLLGIAVIVVAALTLYKILAAIISVPARIAGYRRDKARRRGYRTMTRGFAAIAAGDGKSAGRLAKQTRALLPGETGLPVLLEAQAARLRGEEGAARLSFEELLRDKDASFFGIRGLLTSALDAGDIRTALDYARKALAVHPKQGWIINIVYELELRNRLWDDAYRTLQKIEKHKSLPADHVRRDMIALLVFAAERADIEGQKGEAKSLLKKAHRLDDTNIVSTTRLADKYITAGKERKAAALIEKAWVANPHPDLLALWDRMAPENKPSDLMRRLRWYEKLVAMKPDSADGQMAAAKAAMQDGLYGEARAYMKTAEDLEPSARVYRLRAQLEEQSTHDDRKVREWLEKAADAPPSRVWTCTDTGAVYEQWSPVAMPHGSFNTIIWGYPSAIRATRRTLPTLSGLMLEVA